MYSLLILCISSEEDDGGIDMVSVVVAVVVALDCEFDCGAESNTKLVMDVKDDTIPLVNDADESYDLPSFPSSEFSSLSWLMLFCVSCSSSGWLRMRLLQA